jgi:non-specific serine/threonine protein kinase/serine/threonine-protein kinase
VGAASVAVVALGVGLSAALWQGREAARARDVAEARFEVAHEAARAMIYDVHDAVAGISGATAAREVIVDRALAYLDRLADEAGADPSLRLDLAAAYLRVGNVQGNPTDNNLGQTTGAAASYRRGLALLQGLPPGLPDSLAAAAAETEGRLWEKLGVVVAHTVAPDSALPHFDRALAAHRRALRLHPDAALARTYLATSYINRGDYRGHPYFPNAGHPDAALADYRRARALLAAIPEAEVSLFSLRMEGVTHEREGTLLQDRGRLDAAAGPTRRALALRQRIAARPDAGADALRDVAVSHEAVGRLAATRGRWAEAERELATAQAVYRRLAADDPESTNARQTLGLGHLNLARLYGDPDGPSLDRLAEARRHAAEAVRLLRALADGDPSNKQLARLAADAEALQERISA